MELVSRKTKNIETKSTPVIEHIGRKVEGRNLTLCCHNISKERTRELSVLNDFLVPVHGVTT